MILCFGIFAGILSCCAQGLPQVKFVPRVAWVVDRQNSSLAIGLDFVVDDPDGMAGNPAVVSNLISCKRPLNLRESKEYRPSIKDARKRFKDKVMPFLDESKIKKAVLTVLYVIENDETIEGERKERFREYLGMYKDELLQQTAFNVPDFFARVLLYTTCVDNKEGFPYAKDITDDFIEKIAKNSWVELKLDATTQTLEIIPMVEKEFYDTIRSLSKLRHSMVEDYDYVDMRWLGIDERDLFPGRYMRIEFKNPETKRMALDNIAQQRKLIKELTDCLVVKRQSASGQAAGWPLFPSERMQDIYRQFNDLDSELSVLVMLGDHFSTKQRETSPEVE